MQSYNTILGVINMRQNECTFSVIQQQYHIGSNATQLILKRFEESGLTLVELRKMAPREVETLFYPPLNLKRKDIPEPDFQYWYYRIHAKDSKVNLAYSLLFPTWKISTTRLSFRRPLTSQKAKLSSRGT